MTRFQRNAQFATAALIAGVLCAAPFLISKSHLYSLTDAAILGLFAISYNLLLGHAGLLSFGHSAYFGLGAYATALSLSHIANIPVSLAVLIGVATAAAGGGLIGSICVRRSGTYFAMLTLAFGMLLYVIAWKWRALTLGDDGFGGFMPATLDIPLVGATDNNVVPIYYLVLLVTSITVALTWALMRRTPFGNALSMVRQNEERASFLGYNVFAIKLTGFILAAMLAGLAGAMFAVFHDFVSTHVIGLELSTDVVMMTFIGGTKSFLGPILGSAFFVYFGDFLSAITDRWQLVMGVIFVAMVMYAPRGFAGMVESVVALLSRSRAGRPAAVAREASLEVGTPRSVP